MKKLIEQSLIFRVLSIIFISILCGCSCAFLKNNCSYCSFKSFKTETKDIKFFFEIEQKAKAVESIKPVIANNREGLYLLAYTDSSNKSGYYLLLVMEKEIYVKGYFREKKCYKEVGKILVENKTLDSSQKERIVQYIKIFPSRIFRICLLTPCQNIRSFINGSS